MEVCEDVVDCSVPDSNEKIWRRSTRVTPGSYNSSSYNPSYNRASGKYTGSPNNGRNSGHTVSEAITIHTRSSFDQGDISPPWTYPNAKPVMYTQQNRGSKHGNKRQVIFKSIEPPSVVKTHVKCIDLTSVQPQRAGVILYTVVDGVIYFGLGVDAKSHDLTDLGGGVSYKTDKNAINGALREMREETLEIFDDIYFDDVLDCPVVYDNSNLIIFVHMNIHPNIICKRFNECYDAIVKVNNVERTRINGELRMITDEVVGLDKIRDYKNDYRRIVDPEVCGITWLTWDELRQCIDDKGILYSRVRNFLYEAGDFSHIL